MLFKPMIAFMGVRISWLILDRNAVFARFAACAASSASPKAMLCCFDASSAAVSVCAYSRISSLIFSTAFDSDSTSLSVWIGGTFSTSSSGDLCIWLIAAYSVTDFSRSWMGCVIRWLDQ